MNDDMRTSESDHTPERGAITYGYYDWSSTAPHAAVISAVADATNRDPAALDPLYSRVDPDALDALVGSAPDPRRAGTVRISFRYVYREVTVESDGEVSVRPRE